MDLAKLPHWIDPTTLGLIALIGTNAHAMSGSGEEVNAAK